MTYLLLDKDDITKICGSISEADFLKEMQFTKEEARGFLWDGRVFRGSFVLTKNIVYRSGYEWKLFIVNKNGRKYYADNCGNFFSVDKKGKTTQLKKYCTSHKEVKVSINGSDYQCKNLIAQLFIKGYQKGDVVLLRNPNNPYDVSVSNLYTIDKGLYAKLVRPKRKVKKVGLFEQGELVREFSSVRQAGRELFYSYQTVADYCNNRYKSKKCDLRWL